MNKLDVPASEMRHESMTQSALIFGISGQDGAYLAAHLLKQGYRVIGVSREPTLKRFSTLNKLGLLDSVEIYPGKVVSPENVSQVIQDTATDEIYNLAGPSSVGLSFENPYESIAENTRLTLSILEGARLHNGSARIYNACTSECFGETPIAATESTPFAPTSPYSAAKTANYWTTRVYREAYNLFACSGIMFNHESPFRSNTFVSQKIVNAAVMIDNGMATALELGNLDIERDWGWAPEYIVPMHRMMQLDAPEDFVIATGASHTLKEFVQIAFELVGLNWMDYVSISDRYKRPGEIMVSRGNPTKANVNLGWAAKVNLRKLIEKLLEAKLDGGG